MSDSSTSCMTCHQRLAKHRGLCDACRTKRATAVKAGKTWADLEAKGLARPSPKRGEAWKRWYG